MTYHSTALEHSETASRRLVRLVVAVLLPPLGVFLRVRLTVHFWISLALTLFGYFPGLIHALWVITADRERVLPCTDYPTRHDRW